MRNTVGIITRNAEYDRVLRNTFGVPVDMLPFAGRYRLVDFAMSNLANAGINHIGLAASSMYYLMAEHIGTGREWGLNRRTGDVKLLLTGNADAHGDFERDIEGLLSTSSGKDPERAIIIPSNIVANIDLEKIVEEHDRRNAAITFMALPEDHGRFSNEYYLKLTEDGRVTDMGTLGEVGRNAYAFAGVIVMEKSILRRAVREAISLSGNYLAYKLVETARRLNKNRIYAYIFDGYYAMIDSADSYMRYNMDMLKFKNSQELFGSERIIHTRLCDNPPAIYRPTARVKNCLVASGSEVAGRVENSTLFRGSVVEEGAVVNGCLVMENTRVRRGEVYENSIITNNMVLRASMHSYARTAINIR